MGGGGKFCFFLLSLVNDFLSPYFLVADEISREGGLLNGVQLVENCRATKRIRVPDTLDARVDGADSISAQLEMCYC